MYWNDDKSVLTWGGRDIKTGDKIPEKFIDVMGKDRIAEMKKDGRIADKASGKAEKKAEPDVDEEKRNELMDKAKMLGLKPHHNSGIEKLEKMIDEKNAELAAENGPN